MTAAIILSSIAVTGIIAAFIKEFDQQGPDMFKKEKEEKDNKEE